MNSPEPTSDNRKVPEIAAAELLFQDAEPPASTRPVGPVIATGSSEGFELADVSEHSASPPPSSQSAPSRESASGKPADSRPRARMAAPVAPAVEQVWSRGSEWGSTLVVLACWIAAILGIAYFTLGAELYGTTGLILLVGGLGAVVLSDIEALARGTHALSRAVEERRPGALARKSRLAGIVKRVMTIVNDACDGLEAWVRFFHAAKGTPSGATVFRPCELAVRRFVQPDRESEGRAGQECTGGVQVTAPKESGIRPGSTLTGKATGF